MAIRRQPGPRKFEPKHAGSHAKPDGIRRLDAAAGPEPLPLTSAVRARSRACR